MYARRGRLFQKNNWCQVSGFRPIEIEEFRDFGTDEFST